LFASHQSFHAAQTASTGLWHFGVDRAAIANEGRNRRGQILKLLQRFLPGGGITQIPALEESVETFQRPIEIPGASGRSSSVKRGFSAP
jgi:hypothetical protein